MRKRFYFIYLTLWRLFRSIDTILREFSKICNFWAAVPSETVHFFVFFIFHVTDPKNILILVLALGYLFINFPIFQIFLKFFYILKMLILPSNDFSWRDLRKIYSVKDWVKKFILSAQNFRFSHDQSEIKRLILIQRYVFEIFSSIYFGRIKLYQI